MTRSIALEEAFAVPPDRLFGLLVCPSAIRAWWGAHRAIVHPAPGGLWAAAWGDDEDDPDYLSYATIHVYDPPRRLVLGDLRYAGRLAHLPFEADFSIAFTVRPKVDGASLHVAHTGFPAASEADGFFAACNQGWHDTLDGIRRILT
ncbi:MAG: SRPBCC domain-containing protein [Rubricoccaceae bacterium]|nr:SRPBCC domain-containing protein [Rubricoccaceae bacterium]